MLLLGDTLSFGGTEGQFVEIACRLDRTRWDLRVACLRAEGPLRARLEAAGLSAESLRPGSLRSPRLGLAVWRLARDLRRTGARLVHTFDFYSNVLGVPAARLAGVPVIASQRDLGNLRPPFQQRLHRLMLRLADRVLVNSEAVRERVRRDPRLAHDRVVLVPNGVDADRFSPAPVRTGSRDGPVVVGTLANLRPEKGLADLLRAVALARERCPEVELAVWGEGPLQGELERLAGELGLGRAVSLRGRTAAPEAALRSLDVFVLNSVSEASSNALLEAMATGLPVVATRVGGNPGFIEDQETGLLVPPADPAALAKALIRLVEDRALAARLAGHAREHVRREFAMPRLIERLESLYLDVLGGGPA